MLIVKTIIVKIWKVNIILYNVLTLYLCTLFLVQGSKWTLASLHEKQRTQIQDMLPQQYYNEKVHIFKT